MSEELRQEIELLKTQIAALTDERLPKVDRASKRRDRRQVLGGFGMFAFALLVAGTLSASALAGSNTVTSDDIVDNGIYYTDIRDSNVLSADVKNNALTGDDVNEATLVPTCTSGMIRAADVCYGPPRTANTQFAAHFDCVDEYLRLPSIPEALRITNSVGGVLWTDELSTGPIFAVSNSYGTDANLHPYRCVTSVGARP